MQQACTSCGIEFETNSEEMDFLDAVSPTIQGQKKAIPASDVCHECRLQQLLLWRNESSIYSSICKKCNKPMISQYAPEKTYNDFCPKCYWDDSWSSEDFTQDFDFSRTFFEQFDELLHKAPIQALINMQAENSEYCHRIFSGRNNYLSFIALNEPENLIYTYYTITCKDSIDLSQSQYCQLCYDTVDAEKSYNCRYSNRIRNCRDCYFTQDCNGCHDCFGCKNLHQKSYCIFNEQKTQEEYEAFVKDAKLNSHEYVEEMRRKAADFFLTLPHRERMIINSENVIGATIFNSKDSHHSFDVYEVDQVHHSLEGEKSHHMFSCMGFGENEYCYFGVTLGQTKSASLCASMVGCSNMLYSYDCNANCSDCFGCVGLKKKQYYIFNKQYSKDEYESLLIRIIEHMKETGEWGQFFPPSLCPFAYNETLALHHVPVSREEVLQRGWQWRDIVDEIKDVQKSIPADQLPDSIRDVPDDILNWAIICSVSKKPFRIVKQELDFYRFHGIPIPRLHPDERYARRMHLREPRHLYNRTCAKCSKGISTSYAPERSEMVLCEECYLKEVY